ncbi:hypothetical protein [Citricoccus sp. GCM10030269]|uniref:hypothetical protein n=1 Tax=Citricoccus sp. GCM10030269 TaxID=3273388 RepID=UPI0036102B04
MTRPPASASAGRWALGAAAMAGVIALAGCGTSSPENSSTLPIGSGPTSASSTSSASSERSPESPSAAQDLPSPDLQRTAYDGEPRPTEEIYHLPCLEALAGDDEVPPTEGTGENEDGDLELTPWSILANEALTEGWKYCPTETQGGLAVPASFEVTPDGENGSITGLSIADATGEQVGGFRADVPGGPPEGAEVVEVLEVTEQPDFTGAGDETVYLRSLVVEANSGAQVMVDLVSAPEGADPESLTVWDLAIHDGTERVVIYGTIPLDSAKDAPDAADSELHRVLRAMVGSYQPAVQ